MHNNSTLSIPGSSRVTATLPSLPVGHFPNKSHRVFTLPGLTGPVVMVGSPRTKSFQKGTICHDILSLLADIFDLRGWRKMDPLACFMLAGYTAAVAQPMVFGGLGSSIVALMMPTK
jgi:hypothetical protein